MSFPYLQLPSASEGPLLFLQLRLLYELYRWLETSIGKSSRHSRLLFPIHASDSCASVILLHFDVTGDKLPVDMVSER